MEKNKRQFNYQMDLLVVRLDANYLWMVQVKGILLLLAHVN